MRSPKPPRLISLVTSSCNQARFIARTIESVLAQDYSNVEHIVVDGMSTDGTADVLAAFPHLRVIREPDRGQAEAINKGFRAAAGQILGFLNPGDTLEPGALRPVAEAIEPEAGRHIVMGRCRFIDEDDRFLGIEHPSAFESHRRVLEIWRGHSVPQPSTFWTREVWNACGPLHVGEPLMLDYDLFCRFSRRYVFHRIDQVLANCRLHAQSRTPELTDEQRLDEAIVVSRRYWGSPLGWQYWQMIASYAAFRVNRRVRGARLMRSGREAWGAGHRLRAAGRLAAGALLAPDGVCDVVVLPVLKPALSRLLRHPLVRSRSVRPHTEALLGLTKLHDDGWAGPALVIDLEIEPAHAALRLSGSTYPDRLRSPLELEAFLDGRSLGRQRIGSSAGFSLTWSVADVPPGRHELRIAANTFLVPHDHFGSRDYRPLSYRVTRLEPERGQAGEATRTAVHELTRSNTSRCEPSEPP
jgi:glycosyltransferase involved in cell wall biosynthesis